MKKNSLKSSAIVGAFIFALVTPPNVQSQEFQFQREVKSIPVLQDGENLQLPFLSGFVDAVPNFVDIDSDGDLDLFVSSFMPEKRFTYKISYFINQGSNLNPEFTLKEETFIIIKGEVISPSFGDIDGDGDYDILVGEENGNINLIRNIGTAQNPYFKFETDNLTGFEPTHRTSPVLADIDNDADLDLFAGGKEFYRNIGSATDFVFIKDDIFSENVIVGKPISLADIDNDGDLDLIYGNSLSTEGGLSFLLNIGTPQIPQFIESFLNLDKVIVGNRTTPRFVDIDDDNDFDLIVGEEDGNINLYRNTGTPDSAIFVIETEAFLSINMRGWSAPTFADIDDDGDLDLFLGEFAGRIFRYKNIGSAHQPIFEYDNNIPYLGVGNQSKPFFADTKSDNVFDLFVGRYRAVIDFANIGSSTHPVFESEGRIVVALGESLSPYLVDIDNDGILEMFTGNSQGTIDYLEQDLESDSLNYLLITDSFEDIDVGWESTPAFVDIDGDGDFDLFLGERDGNINFFRNVGDRVNYDFQLETENFASISVGRDCTPVFVDIDADRDFDLFVGEANGGLCFYRNVTQSTVNVSQREHTKEAFELSQNYPNPFNLGTVIHYKLDKTANVKLTIVNLKGEHVVTLVNQIQNAGEKQVIWNGKSKNGTIVANGIYLYRLQIGRFNRVKKMILIK